MYLRLFEDNACMYVYKEVVIMILPTKKDACKSTKQHNTYTTRLNKNNITIFLNMFQHSARTLSTKNRCRIKCCVEICRHFTCS